MGGKVISIWLSLVMLFGLVVIIIDMAPPVEAITIYVDDDGGADYTTIQQAIDNASVGDTVYVYNGTYDEKLVINKTINLTGMNKDTTFINSSSSGDNIKITADWVNVTGFTVTGKYQTSLGLLIEANYSFITDNNILNRNYGMRIDRGEENKIIGNNISSCEYVGIYNIRSDGTKIADNNISSSRDYGIYIYNSDNCNITSNTLEENGILLYGGSVSDWNTHDIDISNTVNGKPIYYWKDQTGGIIPSDAGQVILANCDNIYIENLEFSNVTVGILLAHSSNNYIAGINVTNSKYGIYFAYSNDNNITSNNLSSNEYGIYFRDSDHNDINYNNIWDNKDGIYLYPQSYNNQIYFNNIFDNTNGLKIQSNYQNTVNNNYIADNEYGIYLTYSQDIKIMDNTLMRNGFFIDSPRLDDWTTHEINTSNTVNGKPVYYWKNQNGGIIPNNAGQAILANCQNITVENLVSINCTVGIQLGFSSNNSITSNSISGGKYGLYIKYSHGNDIGNNNFSFNYIGMYVYESHLNDLTDNNLHSNSNIGLHSAHSDGNNISNNYFSYNNYGSYLYFSDGTNFTGNKASSNLDRGLNIYRADWNNITGNNFSSNAKYGIRVEDSVKCTFANNIINTNNDSGIYIRDSEGFTIEDNIISSNRDEGIYSYNMNQSDIINNTFNNNKCGIYLRGNWNNPFDNNNITGNYLSANSYEGIKVEYSFGNNITYNTAHDNDKGIYILYSDSNNITDNNFSENSWGFYLSNSHQNNITNNTAIHNSLYGIRLSHSDWNNISYNAFSYCNDSNIYFYYSDNNTIKNNSVSWGGSEGITLWYSNANNITGNNIVSSKDYGFYLVSTSYNLIYHNLIADNVISAYDNRDNNYWDNGYPSGGNFWSDYLGADDFNGPSQDILGSDNIGDTPHEIDSDSRDNYPLMEPVPDTMGPRIRFISPGNNSIHQPGENLDFEVYDGNLDSVNYSIDGSLVQPFVSPYDISTTGWAEGMYNITISAKDTKGNSVKNIFSVIIDSTKPEILLNSPENNSVIPRGIYINLSIYDSNLNHANYSRNQGSTITFSEPYNISTATWGSGKNTIYVNAQDQAENSISVWFNFTIDYNSPSIYLSYPLNNSIIAGGIILDFSVSDSNLDHVNYSINTGPEILIFDPFKISTSEWTDGEYTILFNAIDLAGNQKSSWYFFTIDSTKPEIILNSPTNNSKHKTETTLDFSITDSHLAGASYSINDEFFAPFSQPYDLSTSGWADGGYSIQINAVDTIGNSNLSWFFITIDSSPPIIEFESNLNHSTISSGKTIQFNILDENLDSAMYSIDGGDYLPLESPYGLETAPWTQGSHTITIWAVDDLGNEAQIWLEVTIDSEPPYVVFTIPTNNSSGHDTDLTISFIFNEPMDTSNAADYVSIFPYNPIIPQWSLNGNTLSISFAEFKLQHGTTYSITIDKEISDVNKNPMNTDFLFVFSTVASDTDGDGVPDLEDPDDDNDGVPDGNDAFPLDESEWDDTDSDGLGNNVDSDDDNDGYYDYEDAYPEDPRLWEKKEGQSTSDMFLMLFLIFVIVILFIVILGLLLTGNGGKSVNRMEPADRQPMVQMIAQDQYPMQKQSEFNPLQNQPQKITEPVPPQPLQPPPPPPP